MDETHGKIVFDVRWFPTIVVLPSGGGHVCIFLSSFSGNLGSRNYFVLPMLLPMLTCASAALLIIFSKAPFMNEHFEFTKSSAHTISSSSDSCRPYLSLAWSCERVTWLQLLSDYLHPRSPSPIGSLQGWAKLPLPGCENAEGKLQANCTSEQQREQNLTNLGPKL